MQAALQGVGSKTAVVQAQALVEVVLVASQQHGPTVGSAMAVMLCLHGLNFQHSSIGSLTPINSSKNSSK